MNTPVFHYPPPLHFKYDHSSQQISRLQWLMRLRWLALMGVSGGGILAASGIVSGVNLLVILCAVLIGIGSNVYIRWNMGRSKTDLESLHVGQAILDTLVLSLVLWASGGSDCPFIPFYIFPVLLAVLLSGKRAFWPTAVASVLGLFWQEFSSHVSSLQIGQWNPISPFDEIFHFTALTLTIGMAAYFAARFTEALREQVQARRVADTLLRLAFEQLEAGVEVIEQGKVLWQNPHASQALGPRVSQTWQCPGAKNKPHCAHRSHGCSWQETVVPIRCQFSLSLPSASSDTHTSANQSSSATQTSSIYELMILSPPKHPQKLALYVERTSEITSQQKWMHTERLASLGRTSQGVAHELNTPLATIQTLGKDLFDALRYASLEQVVREDVEESIHMMIEEVKRCSRITHALLGRAERTQGGQATLKEIIDRSVSLVFPHQKHLVELSLSACETLHFPLDPMVQICVNLLQNAQDAAPNHPVHIQANQDPQTASLVLSIIDHGAGLDEESLSMIFEPFFTTKSPGQGTGLGLYTSYALAQDLQGELTLRNHKDQGAIACLTIPLPRGDFE